MLNNGSNNPMNIRPYSKTGKWMGQIAVKNGFCVFSKPEYSIRVACYLIMKSYRRVGCYTVQQIIERYAPYCENSTMNYVGYVCSKTGFSAAYVPKCRLDVAKIVTAMYYFENGISWNLFGSSEFDRYVSYVLAIIKKFDLKFYYA